MTTSLDLRAQGRATSLDLAPRPSAGTLVVVAMVVHIIAAAVMYHDLVTDLYALFAAAPQLSVLAQGLTRLLAATLFLPPILPSVLIAGAALWLRGSMPPLAAWWLAVGCAFLAADGALRAVGVLAAPPAVNLGDALDMQNRLAPGARMLAALAGVRPGATPGYWLSLFTLGALGAVVAVARALRASEVEHLRPVARRRLRRRGDTLAGVQVAAVALGAYVALGALGRVVLPFATQLFLTLFG